MACQFLALSMDGNSAALISAAGSMGFYGVEILSTEESAARGCEAGHQLLHYHNPLSFAISRLVEAARNAGFSKNLFMIFWRVGRGMRGRSFVGLY